MLFRSVVVNAPTVKTAATPLIFTVIVLVDAHEPLIAILSTCVTCFALPIHLFVAITYLNVGYVFVGYGSVNVYCQVIGYSIHPFEKLCGNDGVISR